MRLPPGIGTRGREVLARGDRGGTLMLLLLNFGDLVSIVIAMRVALSLIGRARPEKSSAPPPITGALARFQQLRGTNARRLMFLRGSINQTIRIRWCLPITEVRTVPTSADSSCHARLLYRFAYQDAILFKLLRQNRIEKGIAAGVQWQDEYGKYLCLFQGHQL